MKYRIILVLLSTTISLHVSAQIDKLIVTKIENPQHEIFINQCKNPSLGVLVFITSIEDIEIDIINYNVIVSSVFENKYNRHILCIEPTTEREKYQIEIQGKGFYSDPFLISNIRASEPQYFKIESENESIALQLKDEEEKRILAENEREKAQKDLIRASQKYNDNNLILGIGNGVTCGDLGIYSRFRFGGIVGAGIEGGVGFSDFDSKLMHWSAGAKFYPYKYWALSAHYGTLSTEKTDSYNSETGEFGIGGVKQHKGWSVLGGYDGIIFDVSHINTGIGFSYTDHVSFAWNIGIGFSLTGLFLKL